MPLVTSTEMFKKAYDGGYAFSEFKRCLVGEGFEALQFECF